jgi:hypothetical protein
MPSKSKTAFDAKVRDWSKRVWSAVSKASQYSEFHEGLFKEFRKIQDEAQAFDLTEVTMFDHVAPVYNHVTSQGYKAHIHYPPLKVAVSNYCSSKPVVDWKGPPDELSRSSSPSPSLPPSPQPQEPPRKSKKKGKAKAAVSDELVRSDHDESEKESAKPRKPPTIDRAETNLPSVVGMEPNPTKCTLCEQRGHVCCVNPKATKAAAACFECNHWRLKCSLAPARTKKAEEDEAAASKELAPKRRKKPTQVPAGQPGQLFS